MNLFTANISAVFLIYFSVPRDVWEKIFPSLFPQSVIRRDEILGDKKKSFHSVKKNWHSKHIYCLQLLTVYWRLKSSSFDHPKLYWMSVWMGFRGRKEPLVSTQVDYYTNKRQIDEIGGVRNANCGRDGM